MMKGMKRRLRLGAVAVLLCLLLSTQALAVDTLVPMGCTVGLQLEAGGVIVAGFSEVNTAEGTATPAADAGLKIGDVITKVGVQRTATAAEFLSALAALNGEPVELTARRGSAELLLRVTPAQSREGNWQLGLWLRDGISGIGTVTFYDQASGSFGALGHGINDTDSGKLLPFTQGSVTDAAVVDVVKGGPGAPGELCGQPEQDHVLGALEKNTESGVFGTADLADLCCKEPVPVATEDEVHLGPASILTTVSDGGVEEYSIEISRIYRQRSDQRFLLLTVTDPRLIERTGGIVQGMSGSPILQDGKLVGAVTHVLLSDATRGYGISIQDMLEAAA